MLSHNRFDSLTNIRLQQQSGLDSASAQLLISRKRAELEDLMNQARRIRL